MANPMDVSDALWAALPERSGISLEDATLLYHRRRAGRTWDQAVADVLGVRPKPLQASAAALAAWKPTIEAWVAAGALPD